MTKSILFALLLFPASLYAQNATPCQCNALIDINYNGTVELLKTAGGKTLHTLKHDNEHEDYLTLIIDNESGNYFHATASYAMSNKSYKGWIKKSAAIGTYDRNYGNTPLPLYAQTNKKAKVLYYIPAHSTLFHTVVHCNKTKWVYVTGNKNGITYSGWLSPDMQCANQYTTCN